VSLLEVIDLHSGYGRVPVIHGLDMHVDEGELVAVLGPNGAGKSTLMKSIARVLEAESGEVRFDGTSLAQLEPHGLAALGLGYVPQEENTFPALTVGENLMLGAHAGKAPGRGYGVAFSRFPILAERLKQRAATLSGGERQMLAVACALLSLPRLLILDEPTSGLAPQTTQALIETILRIKEEGTTILWVVEENPKQACAHCDRVYFMDSGTIVREDTGKELMEEDPNLIGMFLGRVRPKPPS
jgi:ABC-type branched-subunit amino acid transport system ATPase component